MTDWQHLYETGETPCNRGGPSPPLVQWLDRHRLYGRVLVPGCGHGNDLVPLAASGAEEVTGLDLAPGAVTAAGARTAGLPNVSLKQGDLFVFGSGEGRGVFDWVFEHTCFCAIDLSLRDDYARAVAAALKPGGCLLAVFYLQPWKAEEDQAQGPPFGTSIEELDQRFGSQFTVLESYVPDVSYSGREGRELLRVMRRN
jgi:SAM-dependent methyltransferase